MDEREFIDNEIWVENRIEEVRSELEDVIKEEISKLNYKKTIESINLELKKIAKEIKQVDYSKDRAIEGLEQDLVVKLDDLRGLEESLLDHRIKNLEEESVSLINSVLGSVDEKADKNTERIGKLYKAIKVLADESVKQKKIIEELENRNANIEAIVEQKVQEILAKNNEKEPVINTETIDDMLERRGIEVKKQSTIGTATKYITNIAKKRDAERDVGTEFLS